MKTIYVASSWRNTAYPSVVQALRDAGHDVWDWRNPPTGGNGFHWAQTDPSFTPGEKVTTPVLNRMLEHEIAQAGFFSDFQGMSRADVCILLLPSGRSAHMEAGYMCGRGKPVYVLRPVADDPDLMHLLFESIHDDLKPILVQITD